MKEFAMMMMMMTTTAVVGTAMADPNDPPYQDWGKGMSRGGNADARLDAFDRDQSPHRWPPTSAPVPIAGMVLLLIGAWGVRLGQGLKFTGPALAVGCILGTC
jgi:hypothetical protein